MRSRTWRSVALTLLLTGAACSGDGEAADPEGGPADRAASETGTEAATGTSASTGPPASGAATGSPTGPASVIGEPVEVLTDVGIDGGVIKIGYNADLSGAFATLVAPIIEATDAYWEWVNENGGIAGRRVEAVILDSGYDVPKHLENYEVLSGDGAEGVVMIGQSTGSPHTAATAELLVEDDLAAIPLSFYSGWADPEIGQNVFEVQASYCVESLNGVTYLSEIHGDDVAIVSLPGEYGQDGATGAKMAAEQLGLNVVYDGEGAVDPDPGSDHTPIIDKIAGSGADFVWMTTDPAELAEIMGGAVQRGFTGMWAGNAPTFDYRLLETELAPALDRYYTHSAYNALWNTTDTPGMTAVVTQMRQRRPDAGISDLYLTGWINGIIIQGVLEQAARNGDMTRAGVLAAAREATVDLMGLAPNQSWKGDPNDYIVRESYLYEVDSSLYTPDLTVSDEGAGTGFELIEGPYSSPLAQELVFEGACYKAG